MMLGGRRSWVGGLAVAWLLTSGLLEFALHRVPDGRHHEFSCDHDALAAAPAASDGTQVGVAVAGEEACAPCLLQTPPTTSRSSVARFEQLVARPVGGDFVAVVVAERWANYQRGPP